MTGYEFVLGMTREGAPLVTLVVTAYIAHRQQVNHVEARLAQDKQVAILNGQQDKLVVAVSEAARLAGVAEERDRKGVG